MQNKFVDELKQLANPNCKKCYGRGYIGYNQTIQMILRCRCTEEKGHVKYARVPERKEDVHPSGTGSTD